MLFYLGNIWIYLALSALIISTFKKLRISGCVGGCSCVRDRPNHASVGSFGKRYGRSFGRKWTEAEASNFPTCVEKFCQTLKIRDFCNRSFSVLLQKLRYFCRSFGFYRSFGIFVEASDSVVFDAPKLLLRQKQEKARFGRSLSCVGGCVVKLSVMRTA